MDDMSATPANLSNASALLDQLDSRRIAERLEELEGEKSALRVLLRAARAREHGRQQRGGCRTSETD
jgi:hypothetical protein